MNSTKAIALMILLAAVAACDTVNSTERANPVGTKDMVNDKRIISDSVFARRVQIVGVNQATGPGGFLKVQIEMRNTTSVRRSFLYKFEWFDEAGMQLSIAGESMLPRTIEGGESMFISAIAPTVNAKDFRIKIIEQ